VHASAQLRVRGDGVVGLPHLKGISELEDPLWDGRGCVGFGCACRSAMGVPWRQSQM
jgi:hypothetical protein